MNFISALAELDKLYESIETENLEEAAAGFRLDVKNLSNIDDVACEFERKDRDLNFIKDKLDDIDPEITAEDLVIAIKRSEFPKAIKKLAAHMTAKGYKTFGDFAKSFDVNESIEEAPVEEGVISDATDTVAKAVGLKEAAANEDEEIMVDDEPIIDDEAAEAVEEAPVEEQPAEVERQIVLECANCGAITIKAESEVDFDEDTDLVNTKDACQYCEAEAGHKIIGSIVPYDMDDEDTEEIEIEDED